MLFFRWIIDQQQHKKVMVNVQKLVQQSKDIRSKAIKLRRQLIDKVKEYESITQEIKDDENN